MSGYWSDVGQKMDIVDWPRLRATIKTCDSNKLIMTSQYAPDKSWIDLLSLEGGSPAQAEHISRVESPRWWASTSYGAAQPRDLPEECFRLTVLQAGANTKGMGIAWAAGPYPDGGWETNVKEYLQKLGAYIAPIAVSIKGVYASISYPTAPGAALNSISWGVATTSIDGLTEYIHVLNPPAGATLNLPLPMDNKTFTSATMLRSGLSATLVQDSGGVHITIPESWDSLDTVIVMA